MPWPLFTQLTTPRLALVALTLEHAPAVFAYANDPEICGKLAWPRHVTLDDSRRFIARHLLGYARGGHYEWALIRGTDGAFLGTCGFGEIDLGRGRADVGYALAKPYWGQGFATEALSRVLAFGFERLGLAVIEASVLPDNRRSLRVLAKLGFSAARTEEIDVEGRGAPLVQIWQLRLHSQS